MTSKRLKYDVWFNIMYVLIGASIGLITTLVQPDNATKYIEELHKSASDRDERDDNFQKRLTDMNTIILELKNELDSSKN
ncbi:hypothetical protein L3X37_07740 [Sabulilitoribacter arenilitoris]|uniref:Uncharacterized protein n=1 Tax=Wocania arenilitoris TaxID=2044858 RepID=A0AAE3JKM4_9FLAO|nr:hypothetical protein [Wocania arenilitoris]MCF7568253.1 hypothetical protein [Wocania arenilitoris]